MEKNLVIVESPAKAKTITSFLDNSFTVKSSFGHIRDLSKTDLGIDTENNFRPNYVIVADKQKLVSDLRKLSQEAETVWLASDEDREGEAIAWHLAEALHLDPTKTKRIAFHEITKNAILNAIENPRSLNMDLVNAQQARRVIDRLVGYNLSPLLWRKIKPQLSAGRVQSVALRLVVEREMEIIGFQAKVSFKVEGRFAHGHVAGGAEAKSFKATLDTAFARPEEAAAFLQLCAHADFRVLSLETKDGVKSPAAPFTTSTLQQEASRKLGFSVSQTMSVAQHLYEAGLITYMRTDSTQLSSLALNTCKKLIEEQYGPEYYKRRQYKTKSKGAQEAHEAIRPTYVDNATIEGTPAEKRLYDLIRKRTIASQMADARVERTKVGIGAPTLKERFVATGEVVVFPGFLNVYKESVDDEVEDKGGESRLPRLAVEQALTACRLTATEHFTQAPLRYSEASLVKKMEELGIGRPSTYAPTIATITKREYVLIENRAGQVRSLRQWVLEGGAVSETRITENYGSEKKKLVPTDIGILVNNYLVEHFPNIVDYGLTARMEGRLDDVANGELPWERLLQDLYPPFKKNVEEALGEQTDTRSERLLGQDPKTGKPVLARMGRYGSLVQLGENEDPEKKYAGLKPGQLLASITLEEALQLFELPRKLGKHQDYEVSAAIGRFGPYLRWNGGFISLPKTDDPYTVTLERAAELIEQHKVKEAAKHILKFEEAGIEVLMGRFGPYISCEKLNYKIAKGTDPATLTLEDCRKIMATVTPSGGKKATAKKTTAAKKAAPAKKTAAAKKTGAKKAPQA